MIVFCVNMKWENAEKMGLFPETYSPSWNIYRVWDEKKSPFDERAG